MRQIFPLRLFPKAPNQTFTVFTVVPFFLKAKWRPCKRGASNCLPHNEHPFSYFTCVIALFGWSCHLILLFRCANMRNVGKSNQDAKIMTCYAHKHALHSRRSPNKFSSLLKSRTVSETLREIIIIMSRFHTTP